MRADRIDCGHSVQSFPENGYNYVFGSINLPKIHRRINIEVSVYIFDFCTYNNINGLENKNCNPSIVVSRVSLSHSHHLWIHSHFSPFLSPVSFLLCSEPDYFLISSSNSISILSSHICPQNGRQFLLSCLRLSSSLRPLCPANSVLISLSTCSHVELFADFLPIDFFNAVYLTDEMAIIWFL